MGRGSSPRVGADGRRGRLGGRGPHRQNRHPGEIDRREGQASRLPQLASGRVEGDAPAQGSRMVQDG
jgi:hypothetical protein